MQGMTIRHHLFFMFFIFSALSFGFSYYKKNFHRKTERDLNDKLEVINNKLQVYETVKLPPLKDLKPLQEKVLKLQERISLKNSPKPGGKADRENKEWLPPNDLTSRNKMLKLIYKIARENRVGIVSQGIKNERNVRRKPQNLETEEPVSHEFQVIGRYLDFYNFFRQVDDLEWQTQIDDLELKMKENSSYLEISFLLKM